MTSVDVWRFALFNNTLIALLALLFINIVPKRYIRLPRACTKKAKICNLILISYMVIWFFSGGDSHRSDGIVSSASGLFYYINAFNSIIILLSILTYMFSKKNFFSLLIFLLPLIVFSTLSGSREPMLIGLVFVFFMLISLRGKDGRRAHGIKIRHLLLGVLPILVFAVQSFDRNDKSSVAIDIFEVALIFTIDRLAEGASNQIYPEVIAGSNGLSPMHNFDRLTYLFIPAFLVEGKETVRDGAEKMEKKFGIGNVKTQQVPFLLHLDAIYRFGNGLGVFVASLFMVVPLYALILNLTAQFAVPMLVYKALLCFRLYSYSVLGAINFFTYELFKEFGIFIFTLAFVQLLSKIKIRRACTNTNNVVLKTNPSSS